MNESHANPLQTVIVRLDRMIGIEFRSRLQTAADPDEAREITDAWEKALEAITELSEAIAS